MDIFKYREQLIQQLAAVETVIAGMGASAPKAAKVKGDDGHFVGNGRKKRKRMSKAARAKIGAAQRARWAKQKAAKK